MAVLESIRPTAQTGTAVTIRDLLGVVHSPTFDTENLYGSIFLRFWLFEIYFVGIALPNFSAFNTLLTG